jgi:outer membrane protein
MRYAALIAACTLATLLAGSAALATEGVKVGIVDIARLGEECKYKADYEQRMKDLITQKREEGRRLSQDVKARMDEIEKEMMLLSDEAKMEKQRELAAETRKLQEFEAQAGREVQERGRALSEELGEKIKAAIKEVADAQGLDLVFDSGVLLYHKELPDLTDAVLQRLDEAFDEEHGVSGTDEKEEETAPADSNEGG